MRWVVNDPKTDIWDSSGFSSLNVLKYMLCHSSRSRAGLSSELYHDLRKSMPSSNVLQSLPLRANMVGVLPLSIGNMALRFSKSLLLHDSVVSTQSYPTA